MNNAEKTSSTVRADDVVRADWLPRMDFVVDGPPARVWPLVLNWNSWIQDRRSEHFSGEPDTVGAIRKISKLDEDGNSGSPSFTQLVRVEPNRRLVSRILPPDGAPEGEGLWGYTIFNLHDLGEKTLVCYETVAEMRSSTLSAVDVEESVGEKSHRETERIWAEKYIPQLRKLLLERGKNR